MNRFRRLILLLCLCPALHAAEPAVVRLGEIDLQLPAPEGFVRVTEAMPKLYRLAVSAENPKDETLGFYVPKVVAEDALKGGVPAYEKWLLVKVDKALREMEVDSKKFVVVKQLAKSQNKAVREEVAKRLPSLTKNVGPPGAAGPEVNAAVNLPGMVPLPPHHETESGLAWSMFANYEAGGGNEDVAATRTILNVGGRVLNLYAYAFKQELDWTRSASAAWSQHVMAANGAAASSSPAPTIPKANPASGSSSLVTVLVGGVIGGIVLLVIMFFVSRKMFS